MATYVAVSRAEFANKMWRRYKNYKFARHDSIAPVAIKEITNLVQQYPLAFVKSEQSFVLVAVLSLGHGRNLYVNDQGDWLCDYVPAIYRAYPFTVINTSEQADLVCIDTDSGLINDDAGELFFDSEGNASTSLKQVIEFLKLLHQGRKVNEFLSNVLDQFGLIEPWPITIKTDTGSQSITDVYKINETRLGQLTGDELTTLRDNDALFVAYAQLISIPHMLNLGKRLPDQQQQPSKTNTPAELEFDFIDDHGTLSFDAFK